MKLELASARSLIFKTDIDNQKFKTLYKNNEASYEKSQADF